MSNWRHVNFFIFFLLVFGTANAAYEKPEEALNVSPDEISPTSEMVKEKRPEQYQRHEMIIQDRDGKLGIKSRQIWTGSDYHKFSGAYHLHGNYESFGGLSGFELTYLNRQPTWDRIWWGVTLRRTNTYFKHISNNPTSGSHPESEAAHPKESTSRESVLAFGAGMAYRFKFFLDFLPTSNVFEMVQVFATYNQLSEMHRNKTYKGYGVTADYAISRRTTSSFFYGGKFSYNLALVTRAPIDNEKVHERSLTLGWYSLAFEMGYFF